MPSLGTFQYLIIVAMKKFFLMSNQHFPRSNL